MQRPETELRHGDLPKGIRATRRLLAYLLRATKLRMSERSIGRDRVREVAGELADALLALVIAHRSALAFYQALCTRFSVDPTGSDNEFGPIEVWLPAGRVRWDHACAAIDYADLRTVIRESPDFLATFACARVDRDDDSIFDAFPDPPPVTTYRPRLPNTLISPRCYRAVWTLTGPAFHGADTKTGNVQLFRRHPVPDPLTGRTHEVPFIAGNATRGMLRDLGMGAHLQRLGLRSTDIPTSRAHALLAGGAIEKGADTGTVNNLVRSRARELCPPWDLFAGCIDQQIMSGPRLVEPLLLRAWLDSPMACDGYDALTIEGALQSTVCLRETARTPDDVFTGCPITATLEETDIRIPIADVVTDGVPIARASVGWFAPDALATKRQSWKRADAEHYATPIVKVSQAATKTQMVLKATVTASHVDFYVDGDRLLLENLLRDVSALGAGRAGGLGLIHGWEVSTAERWSWIGPERRLMRVLPEPLALELEADHYDLRIATLRAPYWHHRTRCAAAVPVQHLGDQLSATTESA
jgi:hypothetical protein